MLNRSLFALVLGLVLTMPVRSDDLTTAAMDLCEKVKSCAMAQMAEEDITPEMREMMQPMLDNMCESVQSSMGDVPTGHALYGPALACMRSMEKVSCQQMQNPDGMKTPECDKYEKLAREAGIDS